MLASLAAACVFSAGVELMAFSIPLVDLDDRADLQTIVDKHKVQYLGHPTTVLLEDGQTMYCVYPAGHGRGPINLKKSKDQGRTWSDRLPVPENWDSGQEVPTIYRTVSPEGKKRLMIWSGRFPARYALSHDDGETWSDLKPAGEWGGLTIMASQISMKEPGHYMGFFHDPGAYFQSEPVTNNPPRCTLYTSETRDGGVTWEFPKRIYTSTNMLLCEPGVVRSPDGKQLALLARENSRTYNSQIMFSDNEGATWTEPRPMPQELNGDRHAIVYLPDGRLYISFRDQQPKGQNSPTYGDWVAWVGTYQDLVNGRPGQYRIRLKDNKPDDNSDCAYPAITVFPSGELLNITYGHWIANEEPYELAVRFSIEMTDKLYAGKLKVSNTTQDENPQMPSNIKMVHCVAGSFLMGSPEGELGRDTDETQHMVTLTRDFWIGKYEVTQAQYKELMGKNPTTYDGVGDQYPVCDVTWDDAMAFCGTLTEKERMAGHINSKWKYTLPTEAQWEYACRAGTTTALNSGKDLSGYKDCSNLNDLAYYGNPSGASYPVGGRKPNAWGIHDMHGNAWEWCLDWYSMTYYGSKEVTDPTGPIKGCFRVARGGSWRLYASRCRSAYRFCDRPDNGGYAKGLRVVLVRVP